MTSREKLEELKRLRDRISNTQIKTEEELQKIKDRKKRWATYFRKNPAIYIEKRMGFHSFGYQNFSYDLMQQANQYIEVSTRGVGKSLRAIVFGAYRCLVYPGSKVGVTAVGNSQANENFLTAFMGELVFKYSWLMKWLYENKYITTRETDKGYNVTFWNGSTMTFFPCINSSRGLHFDVLIGEELRLIKKRDWSSIAMPMLVTRRAGFRNKEPYLERTDLDEDTKLICITSNRYKNEWFNTMFRDTYSNYFKNTGTKNRVLCIDIFSALRHGLRTVSWFLQQKKEMDELSFRMEILNETLGEVENAFYTREMFSRNQQLKKAFYPPTISQFMSGKDNNRKKRADEFRLISVDFAFSNGEDNDNTAICCIAFYPIGDIWIRNVEYMETHGGGNGDEALLKIRELFWDYEADYIVFDERNGGTVHYNSLTKEFIHPERPPNLWRKNGFTLSDENDLQCVSDSTLKDLRARTIDANAIPCLIPVQGTTVFNNDVYMDLSVRLRKGEIRFLIDRLDFERIMEEDKNSLIMTPKEKALKLIPYIQTSYLINEAVNLKSTWKSGLVSLSEGTKKKDKKDRVSALCYGNYIATKIINKHEVENGKDDFDISKYTQFVF